MRGGNSPIEVDDAQVSCTHQHISDCFAENGDNGVSENDSIISTTPADDGEEADEETDIQPLNDITDADDSKARSISGFNFTKEGRPQNAKLKTITLDLRALRPSNGEWDSTDGKCVFFGKYQLDGGTSWNVLGVPNTQTINGTSAADGGLLLHASQESANIPTALLENTKNCDEDYYTSSNSLKAYINGDGYLNNRAPYFQTVEQAAIATTKLQKTGSNSEAGYVVQSEGDSESVRCYEKAETTDKIFWLSAAEIEGLYKNIDERKRTFSSKDATWFTRSMSMAGTYENKVVVSKAGKIRQASHSDVSAVGNTKRVVVPAFNVDLSKVLFASSSNSSKIPYEKPNEDKFKAVESAEDEKYWRLTLLDDGKKVTIGEVTESETDGARTLTIPYTYTGKGVNFNNQSPTVRISAMITNKAYKEEGTEALYYGPLVKGITATYNTITTKTDTCTLTVPTGLPKGSKVYIFAEEMIAVPYAYSRSVYASELVELSVSVGDVDVDEGGSESGGGTEGSEGTEGGSGEGSGGSTGDGSDGGTGNDSGNDAGDGSGSGTTGGENSGGTGGGQQPEQKPEPTTPVTPTTPITPTTPTTPVTPTEPPTPVAPTNPEPTKPEPARPTTPVTPTETPKQAEPAKPVEVAALTEPPEQEEPLKTMVSAPPVNPAAEEIQDAGYEYPTYRNETPDPNDPKSPEVIVVIDDEGAPTAYRKTVDPDNEANKIYMEDSSIPLASSPVMRKAGHWSVLNLLLAFVSVVAGAATLVKYYIRKRGKKEEQDAALEIKGAEERRGVWYVLSGLSAVLSISVFSLTQDIGLSIGFADRWTFLMMALVLMQVPGILLEYRRPDLYEIYERENPPTQKKRKG